MTQIGKYRVERELGRGAMGVVYKAFDPVVERIIAIKTIRLDIAESQELAHRLRREAKSVGQLEHPNIVTLYDAGESAGLFYIAMQFIQGETLQNRLDRQRWFTLKETQDIFRQLCAGLDFAHRHNVIHRDIKPANVMITNEGVVKLTDFGIAKVQGAGTTQTGMVVGTPSYMSPEQALGKPLDSRSDIFSLGCILYEMITGEKAFPGQNVTTVMYKIVHEAPTPVTALQPGLDPAVEAIVSKALAKRPEGRFDTCAEFASALEIYLGKAAAGLPKTRGADFRSLQATPAQSAVGGTPAHQVAAGSALNSAVPGSPSVTTGSSPSAMPAPVNGAASQTAYGPLGVPLAWLGGGALGTLLIVVIVLLVMQMRRPAGNLETASVPLTGKSQTQDTGKAGQPAKPPSSISQETQPKRPAQNVEPPSEPKRLQKPITTTRSAKSVGGIISRVFGAPQRPAVQNPPPAVTPATPPAQPQTYESLLVKGDVAYSNGQYNDALDAYSRADRLKPNNKEVRRKLFTTLTLLGRVVEALRYK